MTHIGTRGGPRGDDELPPLRPELAGLKGVELLRRAYELERPKPTDAPRRARRSDPVSQSTPPVKTPETPRSSAPVGMPAYVDPSDHDDIPDGPEPDPEEWR